MRLILTPEDNTRLKILCGECNCHLAQIEEYLAVNICNRGTEFNLEGEPRAVQAAAQLLQELYQDFTLDSHILAATLHLKLQGIKNAMLHDVKEGLTKRSSLTIKHHTINPHTRNQAHYINNILEHDITFGIGPAGTGKTFLAVACAVYALEHELVEHLILVRPAIEAGEKLGFLPGNIADKVDPFLRPLYDALYFLLGSHTVEKYLRDHIIELAPLAFMRGRTLNSAFVILDESQNTTTEQMKMFLTRIGFGSKVVITGDTTQIDLPRGQKSGLVHAQELLQHEPEINFTIFNATDVVRHPLVQKIITAYEKAK